MPKNSELTEAVRGKILGLRAGGSSIPKISKALKVSPTTVWNTIVHYRNSDSLKSASRSGRPKAINNDDKKVLKDIIHKGNKYSADKIQRKMDGQLNTKIKVKIIILSKTYTKSKIAPVIKLGSCSFGIQS